MNKGIYSLKHISLDGEETTFRMKDKNGKIKDHFPLTTIDALTTECNNMEELLLKTRFLNIPKRNSSDTWLDGYFYIEYLNNNKVKKLDIAFSENALIHEISTTYKGYYYIPKDNRIKKTAYKIIKIRVTEPKLYDYLRHNSYLDTYLSELIGQFIAYNNEDYQNIKEADRILNIIIAQLSQYKKFRDLTIGINNYYKETKYQEQTSKQSNNQENNSEKQKVKKIMPPKGSQLSFTDIGYNF